jgi:hypothetical protein
MTATSSERDLHQVYSFGQSNGAIDETLSGGFC